MGKVTYIQEKNKPCDEGTQLIKEFVTRINYKGIVIDNISYGLELVELFYGLKVCVKVYKNYARVLSMDGKLIEEFRF